MRIGIDARFYGAIGKGLGRYTEKLIHELEKIDVENEYFIFLRQENFHDYVPKNKRFQKVLADYSWYGIKEQLLFPSLLRKYRIDLMHFPHFNVPLFYRQPFVVTIHDLILLHFPTIKASELPPFLYWVKYWMYRFVIRSALLRAEKILTVSHFTENDILRHYSESVGKIEVTTEAADPFCHWVNREEADFFLESQPYRDKEFCLYVGNAYPHKNLSLILDAAKRFPETHFVFVGKDDFFYRGIRERSVREAIQNVHFTGFVPDRELSVLYRSAILYLFPSLYEGFGLPALEACAYGLPVLAARAGSLPEVLGPAGEFFDPEKPGTFFAALGRLLQGAGRREELIRAGHNRIMAFRWEDMASRTLTLYASVLKRLYAI